MVAQNRPGTGGFKRWFWRAAALLLVIGVAVTAWSMTRTHQMAAVELPADGMIMGAGAMPEWLAAADPAVQKEYVWAAAHRAELQFIPCYCGCAAQGHTSNADCYYHWEQGQITGYDNHAFG